MEQRELGQFSWGETRCKREADFSQSEVSGSRQHQRQKAGVSSWGYPESELAMGILFGSNRL